MRHFHVSVLCILLTILTGCSAPNPTPTQASNKAKATVSSPPSPTISFRDTSFTKEELKDISQRAAQRAILAHAIDLVASKSKDPHALELATFFREHATLAKPDESGVMILEPPKSDAFFFLVVPRPGDEKVSDDWKKTLSRTGVAASYDPDANVMVMGNPELYTEFWYGVSGIHETKHAWDMITNPYDWKDQRLFCMAELDTHAFQNDLVRKVGGVEYENALKREIRRIRAKSNLKVKPPNIAGRGEYDAKLDIPFGKPKSTFEADFRATNLWIHGVLGYIHEDYPGTDDQKLDFATKFMWNMYHRENLLPRG